MILFRRFVEPATVRSPYFSVRSTLVDHPLFLKMNFYQPSKRKWAKLCHFILSGFYYLFLCILSELQNKSIRNSAFYVQCFAAMSFPLINSHYTLAQQFFFLNFIHGFSLSLAGETIFEGDTSRSREDLDFPSLIAYGKCLLVDRRIESCSRIPSKNKITCISSNNVVGQSADTYRLVHVNCHSFKSKLLSLQ